MTKDIDSGGPAFPSPIAINPSDDVHISDDGMTLRDYFAAKAMHAELVTCGAPGEACDAMLRALSPNVSVEQHIAAVAYAMADAMLVARGAS